MSNRRYVVCQLLTTFLLLASHPSARATQHPKIPAASATRTNPRDGGVMIYVPAGLFMMGDNDLDQQFQNCPRHMVTLDAFWIYKNDVTVAQYRKFCQETGKEMPKAPDWGWKEDHPIVNVSWDEAKAYCDWAHTSLPTEEQWEKAARGTRGRKYPWGNKWDPGKLWCSSGKYKWETVPVGSFPAGASPYGCLDMAGNVEQWCADWYDGSYYRKGNNHNPKGPTTGEDRMALGGSWDAKFELYLRCGIRHFLPPGLRYASCGFRCVVRADS